VEDLNKYCLNTCTICISEARGNKFCSPYMYLFLKDMLQCHVDVIKYIGPKWDRPLRRWEYGPVAAAQKIPIKIPIYTHTSLWRECDTWILGTPWLAGGGRSMSAALLIICIYRSMQVNSVSCRVDFHWAWGTCQSGRELQAKTSSNLELTHSLVWHLSICKSWRSLGLVCSS
jgi:hypothetical protein